MGHGLPLPDSRETGLKLCRRWKAAVLWPRSPRPVLG